MLQTCVPLHISAQAALIVDTLLVVIWVRERSEAVVAGGDALISELAVLVVAPALSDGTGIVDRVVPLLNCKSSRRICCVRDDFSKDL